LNDNDLEMLRTHSINRCNHFIRRERLKTVIAWVFIALAATVLLGGLYWVGIISL
jgi:hypothetical protein